MEFFVSALENAPSCCPSGTFQVTSSKEEEEPRRHDSQRLPKGPPTQMISLRSF